MSLRVFACGRTTSGKSEWLWRRYLRREPRLIIADQTGEWQMRVNAGTMNGTLVTGHDELIAAMQEHATQDNWRIIADLDADDMKQLHDTFLPRGAIHKSPIPPMGGVALYIPEVDRVLGRGEVTLGGFWRRGRHIGLSVYSDTQRPSNVSKECTSNCEIIAVLALHEVRDRQYLGELMGRGMADKAIAWARSAPYRVSAFTPANGKLYQLPPEPE